MMRIRKLIHVTTLLTLLGPLLSQPAFAEPAQVGKSPWGAEDELGRLNLMTEESRAAVLSRIVGGQVYDLSVEYYMGMPGWFPAGDPRYTFCPHTAGHHQ